MKKQAPSTRKPVQHPYARISEPEQRKGGGLERQTTDQEAAAKLAEFGRLFGFSTSKRVMVDDGVSAFRGLNASPEHELGKFLADARKGLIPPGDCLVLENYDRLSRQDPWAAIGLVNDLRQLKIHVGRLDRMKLLRYDSMDYGDFFEAAVELMRGNSESRTKSYRNGEAWKKKRQAAREGKEIRRKDGCVSKAITRRLPAWVEERGGKLVLIPERAAVVKRIFQLAASGYPQNDIVKKLNEEGVKPFGEYVVREKRKRSAFAGKWLRAYVGKILRDRRTLGECQPCGPGREPEGPPIADYFPAAVTEDEFYAARGEVRQRDSFGKKGTRRGGRPGDRMNVFGGLLHNARDGDTYYASVRPNGTHLLVNTSAVETGGTSYTFPYESFEREIFRHLVEIDPHEILNGDQAPDETTALRAELERVEVKAGEFEAELLNGDVAALGRALRTLEDRQRDLKGRLAEARERAAHPASEAWGEAQTLLTVLDKAPDPTDARLRLRSALRRMVASIWLLVVPRGKVRLCACQVWFADEKRHRDYLILHWPARGNGTKRYEGGSDSEARPFAGKAGRLDLRKREHVALLEKTLLAFDLTPPA